VRGLHTELAALDPSDLAFARDQVHRAFAEEGRLTRGLVAQPAWQWYLEQLPGMSAELDTLNNSYAERMFTLYEQRETFSNEQDYLTQTEQLSSERQAALERLLSQKTDAIMAPYHQAVTEHLRGFIEGNATTIGHRDRVASLRNKVAHYLIDNPRSEQKPALTKLADQLTGRLQTLQSATEMSLARQLQLVETLIQPNGGLPTIEDLNPHTAQGGKRRRRIRLRVGRVGEDQIVPARHHASGAIRRHREHRGAVGEAQGLRRAAQRVGRGPMLLDKRRVRRAAREGLETECAGAGKEVEHVGVRDPIGEDREQRLFDAGGSGADRASGRCPHASATKRPSGESQRTHLDGPLSSP